MLRQLGIMLCREREKMGEIQKNIADGIISISNLSRVERGAQEVDYFTLCALFERLGKTVDKFELAVSVQEYERIAYRVEIEHSIERRDVETLSCQIAECRAYDNGKSPIYTQYISVLCAVLHYIREQDYGACLRGLMGALACTLQEDWIWKIRDGQRLCNQEIQIVLMCVYCQWKMGDTDGLTGRMEEVCQYILRYYTDQEEQVKIYPHSALMLGLLYLEQGRVDKAYAVCEKGRESLIKNGSLNPVLQMLELEAACLEQMDMQTELDTCRRNREAILFLYAAAGTEPETDMFLVFMKSSFQGEFVITNELLRDLREAKGMTQEALCEGICSQETLSRIEQGLRSPNKRNLYRMLKRLGMERENYYGFIEADDYDLYEKVRQYNRSSPRHNYEEAEQLLDAIESRLDIEIFLNRQFVEMGHTNIQTGKGEVSKVQANRKLWKLLCLTMPPTDYGRLIYRQPFRTEYTLWNCIGVNLRLDNRVEEALHIYEELMGCYKRSRVLMQHHAVSMFTLYLNYAGFLEEHNELDKAETIAREGLLHMVECCRGDNTGYVLANLSLVHCKRGLPECEEEYLRKGYYIGRFYDKIDDMEKIRKAYREKFHREID